MGLYDVHCYAIVRIKVSDVEAASPSEAIDNAILDLDAQAEIEAGSGEFADATESTWFASSTCPRLHLLQELVKWADELSRVPCLEM